MSAHYNRVMMKQLRDPLTELLKKLSTAADQVAKGEVVPEQLTGWETAEELTNSFKMVNCQALAKLSQTLVDALQGVSQAPRRGWSDAQARQVAQSARTLAEAFIPLLDDLAQGADVLPVTLWPQWARLLEQMNTPVPPPVTLFEPGADFNDLAFTRLDKDFLKSTVMGASTRLEAALSKVRAAEQSEHLNEFSSALGEVQAVFDWAYRTPHRRGFMGYWLIVRARLVDARLHDAATLAAPEAIHRLIRNANLELQRFAVDATAVPQERLLEDITPLLDPWDEASQANDVMRELRDRFNLDAFWAVVERTHEKKGNPAGQAYEQARAELRALLERVCDAWARWYGSTGDMKDVIRAFAALVMRMDSFPPDSRNLIKAIQVAMEWTAKRPDDERDQDVSNEVSAGLVTLEDVLSATPTQMPGLTDRVNQQIRRLRAVMVPGRLEYQQLPVIRWGAQRMRQETQVARQKALGQMIETLTKIEEALDNVMREEADVRDVKKLLTDMQDNLDITAHALNLLRLPQHAKLMDVFRQRLKRVTDAPALLKEDKDRQSLTVALPALLTSLTNHMEGHGLDNDDELLAKASKVLSQEAPVGIKQASDWEKASPVLAVPAAPSAEPVAAPPAPPMPEEAPLSAPVPVSEPEPMAVEHAAAPASPIPAVEGLSPLSKAVQIALLSPEGYTDTLDRADPDILEGFFLEAPTTVADIAGWRHTLLDHPTDETAWEDLRRAFHTVKGSGRFVYLAGLTEVAWWLERFVDLRWKDKKDYSPALDAVIAQAQSWLGDALETLQIHRTATLHADALWAALVAFTHDETPEAAATPALPEATAPADLPVGPALAQWAQDPEARAAVHEDLSLRRQELVTVADTQDLELLMRVAHTLRTLSMMVGLPRWEKECTAVEHHLAKNHPLNDAEVMELVDRWLPVIDDLLLGDAHPENNLDAPWHLPEPPATEPVRQESPEAAFVPVAEPQPEPVAVADDALVAHEEEEEQEQQQEQQQEQPDEHAPVAAESGDDSDTDFDLHVVTPVFHDPEPTPVAEEHVEEEAALVSEEALHEPEPAPVLHPVAPPRSSPAPAVDRDALWDEVFEAHRLLMEGGRRLGVALQKLLESEEDEEA